MKGETPLTLTLTSSPTLSFLFSTLVRLAELYEQVERLYNYFG
jgi:hypothetical protein